MVTSSFVLRLIIVDTNTTQAFVCSEWTSNERALTEGTGNPASDRPFCQASRMEKIWSQGMVTMELLGMFKQTDRQGFYRKARTNSINFFVGFSLYKDTVRRDL